MDHAAKICRLDDVRQHADEVTRWLIEEWPDPEVPFVPRRSRLLDPVDCPATLLAVADGRPVGVLGFGRFQRKGDEHLSLFIDALYVHAAARRGGIGTALLDAAVAAAVPFAHELFVYTPLSEWYQARGWVVRQSGPNKDRFVLSRETAAR